MYYHNFSVSQRRSRSSLERRTHFLLAPLSAPLSSVLKSSALRSLVLRSPTLMRCARMLALLVLALVQPSVSAEVDDALVQQQMLKSLKKARPGLKITEVAATPIPGVYSLQVDRGPVLYLHESGQHFIAGGELFAIEGDQFVNLQERAMKPKRKAMVEGIAKKDQIIFAAEGKTRSYVTVFTDVDCGYCRKLHREVPKMNALGIEVRYLAYPRAGLKSESYRKIASAWCADNPQQALTKLKNLETIPMQVCKNNPVSKHFSVGNRVGVRGTPALILPDGTLVPGYLGSEELAEALKL